MKRTGKYRRLGALTLVLLLFPVPFTAAAYHSEYIPDAPAGAVFETTVRPLYLKQLTELEAKKQLEQELSVVEHKVGRGETLISIAKKYRTTVNMLVQLNNLKNPHFIREGQLLTVSVPQDSKEEKIEATDFVHILVRGETIWDLSRRYRVSMESVLAVNGISDPHRLMPGQKIVIPGATAVVTAPKPPPEREIIVASRYTTRSNVPFIWPTEGYISSGFGPRWGRFHYGLDIAANTGTAIHAAAAGVVTVAGWRTGYGYMVRIDHKDGWESVYAHASRLYVRSGQSVVTGQRIAAVGQTGNTTGPHLHLEFIFEGKHKNPIKYLP